METNWHHAFNPQLFLKNVDIEKLLQRNETYAESLCNKLGKPCISCQGSTAPGLHLNEGSYLCKQCFDRISLVQYPEKDETVWRQHLTACAARRAAQNSLIENSITLRIKKIADVLFGISFLLLFIHIGYIGLTIGIFFIAKLFEAAHNKKLKVWAEIYPEPLEPNLRHFHDPDAELTKQDLATLYIFNHWPGYPPFWRYLREVVLKKDGNRCQVTGCPSRLELHIHHIKPVSNGGEHAPGNLVSLCDFHHALEPEKGHERIWGNVKTRYFTLVREHERSNRAASGSHTVRAHLRRLQLVELEDIVELMKIYGMACPKCGDTELKAKLYSEQNKIEIECPVCAKTIEGPQELAEETGPHLAELLQVTLNQGRWKARWDMLEERKSSIWGVWKSGKITKRRKKYKKTVEQDTSKPVCPLCGSVMRVIRPRPSDSWKPFWGCTQFKVTSCKGSARYIED